MTLVFRTVYNSDDMDHNGKGRAHLFQVCWLISLSLLGNFPFPLVKTGRVLKVSSNNPDYFFPEDGADIEIPYSDKKLQPASSTLYVNDKLAEAENAADTMCLNDEAPCAILKKCRVQQNSLCKCGQICVCGIFPDPVDAPTMDDYQRIQP